MCIRDRSTGHTPSDRQRGERRRRSVRDARRGNSTRGVQEQCSEESIEADKVIALNWPSVSGRSLSNRPRAT
eukprot:4425265-Pleurochrysis_carterae.AAC.1